MESRCHVTLAIINEENELEIPFFATLKCCTVRSSSLKRIAKVRKPEHFANRATYVCSDDIMRSYVLDVHFI